MKINIPSSCPLFQGAGSSSAVDKLLKKASCVIFVVPACCRYIFLKIHIYIYTYVYCIYILSVPSLSNSATKKAFIFVVGFDFQGPRNRIFLKSGMVPTFETEITWKSLCIWSQSLCRFLIDAASSRVQSCYKLRARSISCRGTRRNRYNQIVY